MKAAIWGWKQQVEDGSSNLRMEAASLRMEAANLGWKQQFEDGSSKLAMEAAS